MKANVERVGLVVADLTETLRLLDYRPVDDAWDDR